MPRPWRSRRLDSLIKLLGERRCRCELLSSGSLSPRWALICYGNVRSGRRRVYLSECGVVCAGGGAPLVGGELLRSCRPAGAPRLYVWLCVCVCVGTGARRCDGAGRRSVLVSLAKLRQRDLDSCRHGYVCLSVCLCVILCLCVCAFPSLSRVFVFVV